MKDSVNICGLCRQRWILPDMLCPSSSLSRSGLPAGRGQCMQTGKTKSSVDGSTRQTVACSPTHIPADGNSLLSSCKDSSYLYLTSCPIYGEAHALSLSWVSTWYPASPAGTVGGGQGIDVRKGRLSSIFRGQGSNDIQAKQLRPPTR